MAAAVTAFTEVHVHRPVTDLQIVLSGAIPGRFQAGIEHRDSGSFHDPVACHCGKSQLASAPQGCARGGITALPFSCLIRWEAWAE